MGNYIVSARKYRPDTFETVVGQPSITTTLKNAIRNRQLAHAYLFCGPRGVGKTTCARIYAKTINCFNITDKTEACNECESCKSFNTSRSYNIHELDAASNNSVDDIRSLIEQIRIPPQIGKYSIYIIDEVHMLSPNAFNAFLKTLEEPPAHAIFILATTEKHKIIPTILSRCQIFDFNRIRVEDIVVHLEGIARTENINAEIEGLNVIAQKADGAMRDALSIFDQIVSFSEGKVTYQDVIENLNVLDYDYYFNLTDAFLSGNTAASLMLFNEVLSKGFDGHNFVNGLSRHFRDLLVCRDEITLKLLEVGANIREKYKLQSKACSIEFLIKALSVTNQCDLSFKSSKNQRLHVELTLVQLCNLTNGEKKNSEQQGSRLTEDQKTKPADSQTVQDKSSHPAGNLYGRGKIPVEKAVPAGTGSKSATVKEPDPDEDRPDEQEESGSDIAGPAGKTEEPSFDITDQETSARNGNNTLSIKDALRGTMPQPVAGEEIDVFELEDQEDPLATDENTDDFTEKELMDQWKKFANQIRNRHPRLYNTLLASKPSINSMTSIDFEINNPLQMEVLNKIKPELLNHLRRELNRNIDLSVTINETEKGNRLYLPEDKFAHMVKKNPDLAIFKQKFNLDFE